MSPSLHERIRHILQTEIGTNEKINVESISEESGSLTVMLEVSPDKALSLVSLAVSMQRRLEALIEIDKAKVIFTAK